MRKQNSWTGGQYSVLRAVLGLVLGGWFLLLIPWAQNYGTLPLYDPATGGVLSILPNPLEAWDSPTLAVLLVFMGLVASLFLVLGFVDRVAAVILLLAGSWILGRDTTLWQSGFPFIGWLLLAHVFVPSAPFGSLARRGKLEPGRDWHLPQQLYLGTWALLGVGYALGGLQCLDDPAWHGPRAAIRILAGTENSIGFLRSALLDLPDLVLQMGSWSILIVTLLFAPLILIRQTRPIIWFVMLCFHILGLYLTDMDGLNVSMLVTLAFAFDPGWVPPRAAPTQEIIFYDGLCGLCHKTIRWVLAEEAREGTFVFAPLGGPTFAEKIPSQEQEKLPDSLVLQTYNGSLEVKSQAVGTILQRLGGLWRLLGETILLIPAPIRDLAYDGVARIRANLFERPQGVCPLIPKTMQARFKP